MTLPIGTLASASVEVDGVDIVIHSMSRGQVIVLGTLEGHNDQADNYILMCGSDASEEEAQSFRDTHDAKTAGLVIDAIMKLSDISPPVGFRCPECGHEGEPDDFALPEGEAPKPSARKRGTSGR